jgi:uncharacterized RDD family membrane protein YckC
MSIEDRDRAVPVGFEDRMAIATPEGIEVELTLAGIGSRFIAGGIDWAIQGLSLVALSLILRSAGNVGTAIFAVAFFAVIFFYDVLFEVLGGGRTPGKRWTGLRVVRSGGRPITFVRSALRNILRIVDLIPGFYVVGMTAIFITSHNQRLGDLAAGTYVVRDRHGDRRRGSAPEAFTPMDPGDAANWDVSAVSADDVATVRAFLERRHSLEATARTRIGAELADRLRPLVGGASEPSNETFLALLVAAKAARS